MEMSPSPMIRSMVNLAQILAYTSDFTIFIKVCKIMTKSPAKSTLDTTVMLY